MNIKINELADLRKHLHKFPELSGFEKNTAKEITRFAQRYSPDKIVENIGGNGVAVVFEGVSPGKTVLLRCELDALPIDEKNDIPHRSTVAGVSHLCGHDGHMAIMAGMIMRISENRPQKGRVILLFQPSEETGEGAQNVIRDEKFKSLTPDIVFALHNIPGFPINSVVIKNNEFASSSKGMIIKLIGKTSHAAHPEKGINPALAVSQIIQKMLEITNENKLLKDFALITVVGVKVGSRAFGTSAGDGEIMVTLRSSKNEDMEIISDECVRVSQAISLKYGLALKIEFAEHFPATVNNPQYAEIIRESAIDCGLKTEEIENPFRWSEDFGHFTSNFKGAMFGLGSGTDFPSLHNPDFDFPDELIDSGINMFYTIVKKVIV
jgi:amidohydrolase